MTFLSFLGALPASLVALPMDPVVLSKVYSIALSTMKKTQGPPENTILPYEIYWRDINCSSAD